MGRAKGTKKDRAGEPAPGRGVRPKILDELQEIGGMSPAWHRRNHLVITDVPERVVSNRFPLVGLDLLRSLYEQPWPRESIMRLLSGLEGEGPLEDDEVVRALFENEWLRISEMAEQIEAITGERSVLREITKEDIQPTWNKYFAEPLASGRVRPWSFFAMRFMFSDISEKEAADLLREWRAWQAKGPDGFGRFVRQEVPQAFHLVGPAMTQGFFHKELFAVIARELVDSDYSGPAPADLYDHLRKDLKQGDPIYAGSDSHSVYMTMMHILSQKLFQENLERLPADQVNSFYADILGSVLQNEMQLRTFSDLPAQWHSWRDRLRDQGIPEGNIHLQMLDDLERITPEVAHLYASGQWSLDAVIRSLFH